MNAGIGHNRPPPTRPVLRYFGGKWMLAAWIISQFPRHRIYVEPYAGAASVLLRKPRSYAEVYNDIDMEIVNLFRVLRDQDSAGDPLPGAAQALIQALILTPFSRDEFLLAKQHTDEPVERARRLVVRSFQGHGPDGAAKGTRTGFRADSFGSNKSGARDWASYPDSLKAVVERLDGVTIENRSALDLMADLDHPETLHYVDPPYVWETRTKRRGPQGKPANGYTHDMDDAAHEALLDHLVRLEGMVVLSGYQSDLYADRLKGWHWVKKDALADGARARTEMLWLNPAATHGKGLFG